MTPGSRLRSRLRIRLLSWGVEESTTPDFGRSQPSLLLSVDCYWIRMQWPIYVLLQCDLHIYLSITHKQIILVINYTVGKLLGSDVCLLTPGVIGVVIDSRFWRSHEDSTPLGEESNPFDSVMTFWTLKKNSKFHSKHCKNWSNFFEKGKSFPWIDYNKTVNVQNRRHYWYVENEDIKLIVNNS